MLIDQLSFIYQQVDLKTHMFYIYFLNYKKKP